MKFCNIILILFSRNAILQWIDTFFKYYYISHTIHKKIFSLSNMGSLTHKIC